MFRSILNLHCHARAVCVHLIVRTLAIIRRANKQNKQWGPFGGRRSFMFSGSSVAPVAGPVKCAASWVGIVVRRRRSLAVLLFDNPNAMTSGTAHGRE